ncbi:ABC transporter permease [Lysinibacillus antri]|nr:ABC transporter permease subunit [Lysinibacillus antri]
MNSSMFISFEWKQMLRSRWLQLVTILFIFVFVAILMIQQMSLPESNGFTRQTASILNVLLFLLPLFTLTMGSMNVAGDVETGWFALLKTYPMSLNQYIFGKYTALCLSFTFILACALGVAFTFGGIFGGVSLPIQFIGVALALIFIFSAIGILIGSVAKNRLHALALSLVVWALLLLLLSYALMAIGTVIPGHVLQKLTILFLHLNPVEWLRFSYFLLAGQATVLGPTYFDLIQFYESILGKVVFALVTLTWAVMPLLLTKYRLKKRGVEK